jgi:hypothetical protein
MGKILFSRICTKKRAPNVKKCTKMPQNGLKTVLWVNFLLLKARKRAPNGK